MTGIPRLRCGLGPSQCKRIAAIHDKVLPMFLFTVCPRCNAGYDVADLFDGKKLRCKSCAHAFNVTPAPRPRNLPPLRPFARPQTAQGPAAIEAGPAPTYIDRPQVIKTRASLVKPGAAPRPQPAPSSGGGGGGWWGRGGAGGLVILAILLARGCSALTRSNHPAPIQGQRPAVQFQQNQLPPQFQQPPDNQGNFDPPEAVRPDPNQGRRNPPPFKLPPPGPGGKKS
jgi:hypothetical protein